jgi:nucleoside-diphosphate-sugar epimerase
MRAPRSDLSSPPRVVIFGCGYVGSEVARRARAGGASVLATTREGSRAEELRRLGVAARAASELSAPVVREMVDGGASVLVAFPPDGRTELAIAPELVAARRVVYISSTAVYGAARGAVDEQTPVDPTGEKARARLDAERAMLASGAAVLRAAGIYGPFRGLHRRLLRGDLAPGDGANVVSRIHVADVASIVLRLFEASDEVARGTIYVVADDAPVPQIEVIRWLCARLAVPLPADQQSGEPRAMRHDRAVDNRRIKSALSLSLQFPTYREGFEACLAAEGA